MISDHAPTSIDLFVPSNCPVSRVWRFKAQWLADEDIKEYIASQINLYIEINDTPEVTSGTLWKALPSWTDNFPHFIYQKERAGRYNADQG